MTDVHQWDPAAANNNAASPAGFPENMAFGGVNDSAREVMAAAHRLYLDRRGDLVSGGAADAQTLTSNAGYSSLFDGLALRFTAGFANTGAATLNVDALGAQSIVRPNGDSLEAGDIVADGIYDVSYDAGNTRFVLVGSAPVLTQGTKRLTSTTTATLASTAHALQIGATTGPNLRGDREGLQAVDNGVAVSLRLQRNGGTVTVGDTAAENLIFQAAASGVLIQADDAGTPTTLVFQGAGGNMRLGPTTGANMEVQPASFQADNNGTPQNLDINPAGGDVTIDGGGTFTARLAVTDLGGVRSVTGNDSLSSADRGMVMYCTGSGNMTFDINTGLGGLLQNSSHFVLVNNRSAGGQVDFSGGTATILGATTALNAGETAQFFLVATDTWAVLVTS